MALKSVRACASALSLLPPSIRAISSSRALSSTRSSREIVRSFVNSFVTTNYGHFGKLGDKDLTWEQTDKAAALKKAVK